MKMPGSQPGSLADPGVRLRRVSGMPRRLRGWVVLCGGLVLFVFGTLQSHSPARPEVAEVWVIGETEKIRRDENGDSLGSRGAVRLMPGEGFQVSAARNEIVGFQLLLLPDIDGARDVSVALDSLAGREAMISNSAWTGDLLDYRGRHIEIFRAHYLEITQPTTYGYAWWEGAKPSQYYHGPIPDALVPFEVGKARGGAPFDLPDGSTQTVWVDVYVPRKAPAGIYTGTLRVTVAGETVSHHPVNLEVYDFELPDSTHFHSLFHADEHGISERHNTGIYTREYFEIENEYHKLAHRHRMDLNFIRTLGDLNRYSRGYYTGEAYSAGNRYDGPGLLVGNTTYGIGIGDQPGSGEVSGFHPATEAAWRGASDAWVTWFEQNAPGVEIFKYMVDEPDDSGLAIVKERSRWIHDNPGPGRRLKTYCTIKVHPELIGSVDFWAVTGQSGVNTGDGIPTGYVVNIANERKRAGDQVAIYNGTRPGFGALRTIDTDAADACVIPWIAWKYGVDQYYLWHVNWYMQGSSSKNPWTDNYVIIESTYSWGEGMLIYAGEDNVFPEYSRGIRGPIASIRMKNWRRGQQDYEYLWLGRRLGLDAEVNHLVDRIVPAAFDECPGGQDGQPPWAIRGLHYDAARRELAGLIVRRLSAVRPPAPTITEPEDGSTISPEGTRIVWTPLETAVEYNIQMSRDSTFSSLVLDTVTGSSRHTIGPFDRDGKINVRVRAGNGLGFGPFSVSLGLLVDGTGVGVEQESGLPLDVRLDQNYPNPFNAETTIRFHLPESSHIVLDVLDVLGGSVATLMSGPVQRGDHSVTWNGSSFPSGVYYCRLRGSGRTITRQMLLLR